MLRKTLIATTLVLTAVPVARADLSEAFAGWGEGPVQYLMTHQEQRQWESIHDDAEAQRFVDLFWSRRDPDLDTPVNEFKQEFDRRVALADARFGSETHRGALTDRGKVLILLGEPRAAARRMGDQTVREMNPGGSIAGESTADVSFVYWEYETARLPVPVPTDRLVVGFYETQRGSDEFVLDRSSRAGGLTLRVLRKAPEAYLVHPELERPRHPASATPAPGASAAAPAAPGASEAAVPLPPAARAWLDAEPAPWPDGAALRTEPGYGGGGDKRPLWLQLELPPEAAPVDALVARWSAPGDAAPSLAELPFQPIERPDGRAYQATLWLEPGEYALELAAGAGAEAVAVRHIEVALAPVGEAGVWLSPVWTAPRVVEQKDAPLGSPFNVGGWHLLPSHRVTRQQDLSYFGYVQAPPGGAPRVAATVTVRRDGHRLGSPFTTDLVLSPVREGLWMYGSSLTLGGLPEAGDYTLELAVREKASGETVERTVELEVAP